MRIIGSFLFSLLSNAVLGQSIITEYPQVESRNTREAKIIKVELTSKNTIIYMSFLMRASNNGGGGRSIEELLELYRNGGRQVSSYISIKPSSYLIGTDGTRKFKFIRAVGIPEEPEKMDVFPGEKVNFKLYFERLEPGIEEFDLYEGRNNEQVRYWNYNGIKIKNPLINKNEKPVASNNTSKGPVFLQGKILDNQTNKGIVAKIELKTLPSLNSIDSVMSFMNSGAFKMGTPITGKSAILVSAPGYLVEQLPIDYDSLASITGYTKIIKLKPLHAGDLVEIDNLYFETAQYKILENSHAALDRLILLLQNNPNLRIKLEGHTDIVGEPQANKLLSEQRVGAVKDYLVQNGIATQRIETKGWGSEKPLNPNGTAEERSKNRRVEFRILSL